MIRGAPAISYSQCKNCARPSGSASCRASSRHFSAREVKARRRAARYNLRLGRAPAMLPPPAALGCGDTFADRSPQGWGGRKAGRRLVRSR